MRFSTRSVPKGFGKKKRIGTQATFNAVIKQKVGRFFEDGRILHLSNLATTIHIYTPGGRNAYRYCARTRGTHYLQNTLRLCIANEDSALAQYRLEFARQSPSLQYRVSGCCVGDRQTCVRASGSHYHHLAFARAPAQSRRSTRQYPETPVLQTKTQHLLSTDVSLQYRVSRSLRLGIANSSLY